MQPCYWQWREISAVKRALIGTWEQMPWGPFPAPGSGFGNSMSCYDIYQHVCLSHCISSKHFLSPCFLPYMLGTQLPHSGVLYPNLLLTYKGTEGALSGNLGIKVHNNSGWRNYFCVILLDGSTVISRPVGPYPMFPYKTRQKSISSAPLRI